MLRAAFIVKPGSAPTPRRASRGAPQGLTAARSTRPEERRPSKEPALDPEGADPGS